MIYHLSLPCLIDINFTGTPIVLVQIKLNVTLYIHPLARRHLHSNRIIDAKLCTMLLQEWIIWMMENILYVMWCWYFITTNTEIASNRKSWDLRLPGSQWRQCDNGVPADMISLHVVNTMWNKVPHMDVKYCLFSESIRELLTEFKDQTILTTRHRAHSKTYISMSWELCIRCTC